MPRGSNRSPHGHPPLDRGRNLSARLLVRVGEDLGRSEASRLTRKRRSQSINTPSAAEAKPRLRGVSHEIAFFIALPLGAALAVSAHGAVARTAASVFAASVAAMFGVSGLFHRIAGTPRPPAARTPRPRDDLRPDRRHVHAGGSPCRASRLACANPRDSLGRSARRSGQKLVWRNAPSWIAPATCIALGWIAASCYPRSSTDRRRRRPAAAGGGVAYTTGAVVYAWRRPDPMPDTFGYHELFHAFVIVAVACQYAAIAFFVLPRA